jgi:uracil phosphoribosyltransferase
MPAADGAGPSAPVDEHYRTLPYRPAEIAHRYGPTVHLLADPLCLLMLARLSAAATVQPELNRLLLELYRPLLHAAIAAEFPRRVLASPTRMARSTPAGVWTGEALRSDTAAVCVAVSRAGLLPSQAAFDLLTHVLHPTGVRQDHLTLARTVDDGGAVTGAGLLAAKIGGGIEGAMVIIADPMGATGSTVSRVVEHYHSEGRGTPARIIAAHLIVTPEYLRRLRDRHPEVVVYALRLDRGLSSAEVLATDPGTRWQDERGLDEHDYIVPGAGGLGELINNSDA